MTRMNDDINDDEIRVITPEDRGDDASYPQPPKKTYIFHIVSAIIVICAVMVAGLMYFSAGGEEVETEELVVSTEVSIVADSVQTSAEEVRTPAGYVEIRDTMVNGNALAILTPRNATPRLHVGTDALEDGEAVLVVQAADVRQDNWNIVGAYVLEGELLSKGQSKAGFCAIINGVLTIGVADATPLLEQAIESDGYFFRQYPLVVGNQVVENKPKGRSLRKALAEWNGEMRVVMSRTALSFSDFSQTLVDLGVSNAIYLVGSSAYGFAVDRGGQRMDFGRSGENAPQNVNYIVWK